MNRYLLASTAAIIAIGAIASNAEARTRCSCQRRTHVQTYGSYDPQYSSDRHVFHHHTYDY